jgi:hypothetical protein
MPATETRDEVKIMAPFTISPRKHVAEGITSSHSYDAYHRMINGTTYRFVRHHHVMSPGHEGIQAYRLEISGERIVSATEVMSVGARIPKGW